MWNVKAENFFIAGLILMYYKLHYWSKIVLCAFFFSQTALGLCIPKLCVLVGIWLYNKLKANSWTKCSIVLYLIFCAIYAQFVIEKNDFAFYHLVKLVNIWFCTFLVICYDQFYIALNWQFSGEIEIFKRNWQFYSRNQI